MEKGIKQRKGEKNQGKKRKQISKKKIVSKKKQFQSQIKTFLFYDHLKEDESTGKILRVTQHTEKEDPGDDVIIEDLEKEKEKEEEELLDISQSG